MRAFSWTRAGGMIPIPPLPGGENSSSNARAVNNAGQVVGRSGVAGGSHAFLWTSAGGTIDLGVLGSSASITPYAIGNGINNAGTVVGASSTDRATHMRSSRPRAGHDGSRHVGRTDDDSIANDVNDAGVVVGSTATAGGEVHAFVWTSGGGMVDIETIGRYREQGVPNQQRGSGGRSETLHGWELPCVPVDAAGGMVDLGTLGAPSFGGPVSMATDINDSGQIVGSTTVNGVVGLHPFSWTPEGGMVAITSDPTSFPGQPSGINNIGNIVGDVRR